MSCISVKESEINPGQRLEKPLDDSEVHEWLKEPEIVGPSAGIDTYLTKLLKVTELEYIQEFQLCN